MDYYKVTYERGMFNVASFSVEYEKDGLLDLIIRLTNSGAKVTKVEKLNYKR